MKIHLNYKFRLLVIYFLFDCFFLWLQTSFVDLTVRCLERKRHTKLAQCCSHCKKQIWSVASTEMGNSQIKDIEGATACTVMPPPPQYPPKKVIPLSNFNPHSWQGRGAKILWYCTVDISPKWCPCTYITKIICVHVLLLEMFMTKYSTGFMTKEEFIQENMAIQGGNSDLWEEVFTVFNSVHAFPPFTLFYFNLLLLLTNAKHIFIHNRMEMTGLISKVQQQQCFHCTSLFSSLLSLSLSLSIN